ncbi:hypothetical protein [Streptomyces sp. NPDC050560]|uniref:hypothetical protein n=1 Tax=Streptomyces sp. NPDC050560 TaxID=3365630 RepID=UPI00379E9720
MSDARIGRALLGVCCLALLASGCGDDRFPHQYEDTDTNVSLETALKDHQVTLPRKARDVRYSANNQTEGYPLLMEFRIRCASATDFITTNSFKKATRHDMSGGLVSAGASEAGWRPTSGDAWYVRHSSGHRYSLGALISPESGGDCHVWAAT